MTHTNEDDTFFSLDLLQQAASQHQPEWLNQAACQEMDLDEFFEYDEQVGPSQAVLKACLSCQVREQCLDTILSFESNLGANRGKGVFAGMNPTVRLRFAKTTTPQDRMILNTAVIQEQLRRRIEADTKRTDVDKANREKAAALAEKPRKNTRFCPIHNYPAISTIRANANLNRVGMFVCYFSDEPHHLFDLKGNLLTRKEYEDICAAN